MDVPGEVTVLLRRMRTGDPAAAETLIPLILGELRGLARHYMRGERMGHTLQPTALVNEAYIRLVGDQSRDWQNRAHFIGVTASLMRRILVDHTRKTNAAKRGGGVVQPGDKADELTEVAAVNALPMEDLIALDDALDALDKMSSRQRQIVEMRYFGGLSVEETAEVLQISPITVKRDWLAARAWLRNQMRPEILSLV